VQGVQWLAAAAAAALRGLRQHQVVAAWWQYVQDQVGDEDGFAILRCCEV
jgi:hypothetical protein